MEGKGSTLLVYTLFSSTENSGDKTLVLSDDCLLIILSHLELRDLVRLERGNPLRNENANNKCFSSHNNSTIGMPQP